MQEKDDVFKYEVTYWPRRVGDSDHTSVTVTKFSCGLGTEDLLSGGYNSLALAQSAATKAINQHRKKLKKAYLRKEKEEKNGLQ